MVLGSGFRRDPVREVPQEVSQPADTATLEIQCRRLGLDPKITVGRTVEQRLKDGRY